MDEALRRFNAIGNARGIIAGFDADCTCSPNYLTEIENTFFNTNVNGCSVYFEHPTDGNEFEPKIYESITSYELYLRYYVEALRNARFPYAFHTLGSSFAVTAEAYARQGGMNKRKAGEDFYFLHKIIPMGNFVELNSCAVYPSPRCSNRVPFGTGAAVNKILQFNNTDYLVFNPRVFEILQPLFDNAYTLMGADKAATCESFNKMHPALSDFLKTQKAEEALETINENCKNKRAFFNAFYNWFNGLMVLQFLNFAHDKYFEKVRISQAVMSICNLNATKNIELLFFLRNKQRSSGWQPINYRQQ